MRVLTHGTVIQCPHGVPAVIPSLGHHLAVAGTPALTAEEIEQGTVACPGDAARPKCTAFTVVAGKARHLPAPVGRGRALARVRDTLRGRTNSGRCRGQRAPGSLPANARRGRGGAGPAPSAAGKTDSPDEATRPPAGGAT